jgi:hypothetical protein
VLLIYCVICMLCCNSIFCGGTEPRMSAVRSCSLPFLLAFAPICRAPLTPSIQHLKPRAHSPIVRVRAKIGRICRTKRSRTEANMSLTTTEFLFLVTLSIEWPQRNRLEDRRTTRHPAFVSLLPSIKASPQQHNSGSIACSIDHNPPSCRSRPETSMHAIMCTCTLIRTLTRTCVSVASCATDMRVV